MDLLPLKTTSWFALHILPQSGIQMMVQTYEVSVDSLNGREIVYADKDLKGGRGHKKLCWGIFFFRAQ